MTTKETPVGLSDAYRGVKANRNGGEFCTAKHDKLQAQIIASNWRWRGSGTMIAFVDLLLPSGLKLIGCTYHVQGLSRWVLLPGRPKLDDNNRARVSLKTGKPSYSACVVIEDWQTRERFKEQALKAIDVLLGKDGEE